MIDVSVKLPELETLKLESLNRGDAFMLPNTNNAYRPQTLVYMSLGYKYNPQIDCVCLNDGSVIKFGAKKLVIPLHVTMKCKYEGINVVGLPF
jgi:hypothetical protein